MQIKLDLDSLQDSPHPKERVIQVARLNEILGCLKTLERQLFTWTATNQSKRATFLEQREAVLEHVESLLRSVPSPVDADLREHLAQATAQWNQVRPQVEALN